MTKASDKLATRRARAADTRAAILVAFLRLLATRGLSAASVDGIARSVGITKGAIYWHFRSKDEMFAALLDSVRAKWDAAVLAPASAEAPTAVRLQRLFAAYSDFYARETDSCLVLQRLLLEPDPRYSVQAGRIYKHTVRALEKILDDGKARGDCRESTDTERVARQLLTSLLGATQLQKIDSALTVGDTLEEARRMVLTRILF